MHNQGAAYALDGQEMSDGSISPYDDTFIEPGDIDVPALPPLPPSHFPREQSLPAYKPGPQYTILAPYETSHHQLIETVLRAGAPPLASPSSTASGSSGRIGLATSVSAERTTKRTPATVTEADDEADLTEEEDNLYTR